MNILLTGADGFTGRHFAVRAQAAGHTVLPLNVDLRDKVAVVEAIKAVNFHVVVHLAAISFVGHADDTEFYAVNVLGSMNLLEALVAQSRSVDCVLLASSANIYGNSKISPVVETQPPAPVNNYAMSKLAMEYMAKNYASRLPIVVARPFNYTGPGQGANFVIPKLVNHFVSRSPVVELGNLHVEREFNDVRTLCDAYLALLKYSEIGEVYNVCSGKAYTLQEIAGILTQLTGHDLGLHSHPAFVRANEVDSLFGDPQKLQSVFLRAGVTIPEYDISDTLQWMLAAS